MASKFSAGRDELPHRMATRLGSRHSSGSAIEVDQLAGDLG
jgi:hypothetical protein